MPFSVPVLPASGPRVQLRGWRDDDLDAFAALDADAEAGYWLGGPFDRAASRARMAAIRVRLDGQGFGFWALELPGVAPFIGCAGLNRPGFAAPFLPAVEIGWRLARPYQRRGLALEAARQVLAHAFGPLGLTGVVAFTAIGNVRSRALMVRLGMQHDPDGDFDHPQLPAGHPLRRHVLYRLARDARPACAGAGPPAAGSAFLVTPP